MSLKITRAGDPIKVDRINLVLYSQPGIGKTSLAFTADKPLLLDFDNGAHRAANRKDTVRVAEWSDVANITADDLAPFNTIVIDTAGRALDAITANIIKTDPKGHKNGALTLPGYGQLKTRFTTFLKLMNSFGKDVVLVAHMEEQRSGDEVIERLDVQGGSKGEIYKAADAMGRISIINGQRWLRFSPTDAAFGKNPGQLEPLAIPAVADPAFATCLADVIRETKERMNAMSEEQLEAQRALALFNSDMQNASTPDDINGLMKRATAGGHVYKLLLMKRAEALGLMFDKGKGEFIGGERGVHRLDTYGDEAA